MAKQSKPYPRVRNATLTIAEEDAAYAKQMGFSAGHPSHDSRCTDSYCVEHDKTLRQNMPGYGNGWRWATADDDSVQRIVEAQMQWLKGFAEELRKRIEALETQMQERTDAWYAAEVERMKDRAPA
jgi:hypothetical protein